MIIYSDNQGAIALAKNAQYYGRTKYINANVYFVCECVTNSRVDLCYVPTTEQVTNGLTKPLCRDKFVAFRKAIGVK